MPGKNQNTRNRARRRRRRAPRRDDRVLDIKIECNSQSEVMAYEISKVLDTGTRRVRDSRLVAITLHGSATTQISVLLRGDFVEDTTVTLCVIPSMRNQNWSRRLRMPRRVCNYFHDAENNTDASRILLVTRKDPQGGLGTVDYVTFHFLQESNPVLTYNISDGGDLVRKGTGSTFRFQLDGLQVLPSLFSVLYNDVRYLFQDTGNSGVATLLDPDPGSPPAIPEDTPLDWKIE